MLGEWVSKYKSDFSGWDSMLRYFGYFFFYFPLWLVVLLPLRDIECVYMNNLSPRWDDNDQD